MARRKKIVVEPKILRYPDSSMQSAIAAVREGRFKIREASRHFGVPHSTLINKLKGRVPEVRKMGRSTYFNTAEENLLTKYILANAKKGIPLKRRTLIETVKKILDDEERVTPFKNNRPGRKWLSLFLKRQPVITEKHAEGISTARANVTVEDIKNWHKGLKDYLTGENALDILENPQRIFNGDESGFQTCPESGKVLGPVGMNNFYQIKSGKQKEQLTVMVTISAAGQVVPPMIVYPLVRISKEIATNVPEDWAIGKSPKGWMTGPLYYEYIANIFDPWLKANHIKKPVLLLIDGHRSHMTLQVSQYCADNQIIAYALFPNSTHISQPADVSVFKCLKSGWKNTVHEYKHNTSNRQITRAVFAPLLAKVFKEKVTSEVIQNGFKKCGIFPFNVSNIDITKCMDHDTRIVPLTTPTADIGVETLLLFESLMPKGRVQQFRQSNSAKQWEGEECAKELFYVWKKISQRCVSNTKPTLEYTEFETQEAPNSSVIQRVAVSSPSILETSVAVNSNNTDDILVTAEWLESMQPVCIPEPKTPPRKTSDLPDESGTKSDTKIMTGQADKQKLISPAFGKHILWPSDSPFKKRKTERLPFATTSKKWQDYWSSKEKEKIEKIKKAEDRKRIREDKKKQKTIRPTKNRAKSDTDSSVTDEEEITEQVQKSDSETDSCNEKENDFINCSNTQNTQLKSQENHKPEEFVKGDFVIVKFLYSAHSSKTVEKKYIGQVIDALEGSHVLVKFMRKSPKVENTFVFPQVDDEQLIRPENVVLKIRPLTVARGRYVFPKLIKDYACC